MNEQERIAHRRALNEEWTRALQEHGSDSVEYRRAVRQLYRSYRRSIDYLPDYKAMEVLQVAMQRRYAWSFSDAINRALAAWGEMFPEETNGGKANIPELNTDG